MLCHNTMLENQLLTRETIKKERSSINVEKVIFYKFQFRILIGGISFTAPRPAFWNQCDLISERSK